jgi:hypothetical protein
MEDPYDLRTGPTQSIAFQTEKGSTTATTEHHLFGNRLPMSFVRGRGRSALQATTGRYPLFQGKADICDRLMGCGKL